ncbi:MAG: hypothetical protein JW745_04305, partial [Sedimentisphaerales bacterium]|nr:hypothetical protein [Sedimentisphaerales bacterium]
FNLTLNIEYPHNIKLTLPDISNIIKDSDFNLLQTPNPSVNDISNGNKTTSITYRLEPLNVGQLPFPELTVEYYAVSDDGKSPEIKHLSLKGPLLTIADVASSASSATIADIKQPVELPASYTWLIWLALVVFLIVIALLIMTYIYSKKQLSASPIPVRPAHEIALERLNALIAENLLESGRVKEFYEKLSYIIRLYIEHRYALKAPERTTEEFLQEATNSCELPDIFKDKLREFLMHCDMVKFAKYAPTPDETKRSVDLARNFIESTASFS